MWNRVELKKTAKERLKSYQGKAILVCLIITIIEWLPDIFNNEKFVGFLNNITMIHPNLTEDGIQNYITYCTDIFTPEGTLETMLADIPLLALIIALIIFRLILTYLILYPLRVGQACFFYKNRFKEAGIEEMAYAFDGHYYMNIVKTQFITFINILFFMLLFIVPGIVCALSYYFVPYILAEHPLLSTKEAMELSKKMTDGHKKEMFVYTVSFIGWNLLGTLTLGITDIIFATPYRQAADAELYDELKRTYNSKLIECIE